MYKIQYLELLVSIMILSRQGFHKGKVIIFQEKKYEKLMISQFNCKKKHIL